MFLLSPPVRGRGLKLNPVDVIDMDEAVAPCAGAWVEICQERGDLG